MKKTRLLSFLFLSLVMATSCSEEGIDIEVYDPQHVVFIHGLDNEGNIFIDQDLIDAFGEENIHWGHTPPSLEGISFKIKGMDYVTCIRYIFNIDPTQPPIQSHADPPTYDGSFNYHHFYHHTENIASHKLKTIDTHGDTYIREEDTVYIIGNEKDLCFTAYYEEEIKEEGSGRPTNAILISGTLVYDDKGNFLGINNYRIGKKILSFKERPTPNAQGVIQSYAEGTIEVKTHLGMAPAEEWDQ